MRRLLALLIVALALAPGTWLRTVLPKPDYHAPVTVRLLALPKQRSVGPFELTHAWQLTSPNNVFGGYSALVVDRGKELIAFADLGFSLRIPLPDPTHGVGKPVKIPLPGPWTGSGRDVEAATFDAVSRKLWLAVENADRIVRFSYRKGLLRRTGTTKPPLLARWHGNAGPETLLRLPDGRFVTLREAFRGLFDERRHEALLFTHDPIEDNRAQRFEVSGPPGFRPTDMAQLPDGRILVLFREVIWGLPPKFGARLAIGDPDAIKPGKLWSLQQVAALPDRIPLDNYEGLAVEPLDDGKLAVWLISDDNRALTQRTLLLRFTVDPDALPPRKKARGLPARSSDRPD